MTFRKGLDRVVHLVRSTVRNDQVDTALAQELGWQVEESDSLIALHPTGVTIDRLYFRKGKSEPYVLQIPHAKNEIHLEAIAPTLFDRLQAKALWLTVVKRSHLDSAHVYYCDFTAATVGAAQANPSLMFLSIHGFLPSKINGLWNTDVIVSGGTWWPTARAHTVYRKLKWRYRKNGRVVLFPWDVSVLGGTTNVQGQVLRSLGSPEFFLHFELSQQFRSVLREDGDELNRFGEALRKGLSAKPDRKTLNMIDPWQSRVGRLARFNMTGADMLAYAMGMNPVEFISRYGMQRERIAHALGITMDEVNYYLDEV